MKNNEICRINSWRVELLDGIKKKECYYFAEEISSKNGWNNKIDLSLQECSQMFWNFLGDLQFKSTISIQNLKWKDRDWSELQESGYF